MRSASAGGNLSELAGVIAHTIQKSHMRRNIAVIENTYQCRTMALVIDSGSVGSTNFEGCRESRRCSRDTYPESYITKYTSIQRKTLLNFFRICGTDLHEVAVLVAPARVLEVHFLAVPALGLRVHGLELGGAWFGDWVAGFRVKSLGCRVWG